MKVTFKTGSEANYGSTNGELFFASNTKQIMLNGIKYIPKKLSELTNDSGFITSITKSMVENVLTGNITSHTHSYLSLTGGTLTGNLTCNDTITATSFNGSLNGTAANASKLSSHTISELTYANIYTRNKNNGILVQTDFDATANRQVYVHIWGNGYDSGIPINTYIHFYNYNYGNSIINYACNHYGLNLGNVYVFNYNGKVCFWFDVSKWMYQTICVLAGTGGYDANTLYKCFNHVTSLDNVAKPTEGVTREVTITPRVNAFLDSKVESATKLATPRTFKVGSTSKSFDGSGDIEFALNSIITQSDTINVGTLNVAEQLTAINITIGNHLSISSGTDISGLTPSMIGAAEASHNHDTTYLKLSGGTMSNANLVTNLNADLLDGYHAEVMVKSDIGNTDDLTKFTKRAYFKTAYISEQGDFCSLVVPTWSSNKAENYYITELRFKNDSINPKIRTYSKKNGISSWRTLALLTDNVASSSKWATARTITLTGSVTGSVSIDGSQNASLDTTLNLENKHINVGSITAKDSITAYSISATNLITCGGKDVSLNGHTHTFASLESKPSTLGDYGITDAYTKTETNTELGKYLPLTGGTLTGALTVPTLTSTGGIMLGIESINGSLGIKKYNEGFIGFSYILGGVNGSVPFEGISLGWGSSPETSANSVRINASTFTYKGNNVWHSGNLKLGYVSSGLSRAVQKDTNGNLYIVAPSLFEQGISNNYPKNLRWSNEIEGQLVYDKEIEAGNFDTVEIGIPLANGTSKGFMKSISTVTNVTGYTPCPVVSGTPYYKLDTIELDYTDFLEIGSGNIESHLPITIKVQEGGSLKYLFDYTVDNIPRLLTISEGNFCKYFFWLQQTDDDTPIVAYYHCQFNDLWLVIDSPNREIRISQGGF